MTELTNTYTTVRTTLIRHPSIWLITGVAGFIGSNLLETLLGLGQKVIGLDNFATGYQHNLDQVQARISAEQWGNFQFTEGDILDLETCRSAAKKADYVLHQAALGSVPRSIEDPISTNQNNINGFLNMLVASRDAGIKRFIYAASSSTYGDHPDLPKIEHKIGKPLSPYAVTKLVNELYAEIFARTYGFKTIGLRYFNIFGRHQDPEGAYAAVIPKWIAAMVNDYPVFINGDGETSRDFCYIDNVVQANLLAATTDNPDALDQIYNVAVGDRNTLNNLFGYLKKNLAAHYPHLNTFTPTYRNFREGDVRHSHADISKAKKLLGYSPTHKMHEGLIEVMDWYINNLK